ncbi:hypothetical protein D1007_28485 [Hordeum vulgare]|nr:hypothetical protein D1007_28485 [Hordeum vulgare]
MSSPRKVTEIGIEVDYVDLYDPPTTHLIATIEDLIDVLDYASEELEDMDDEAYYPTLINTGQWTATSTYDVYMVDTPHDTYDITRKQNGDKPTE